MYLPSGSPASKAFVTNLGLITSTGQHGDNIMTAEWTHHVSYSPGLLAVCIHAVNATAENIIKTKEFGVSICAQDQSILSSVAGGSSGRSVNKIAVLKKLGFTFTQGKKIKALLVADSVLQLECNVVQQMVIGDHIMFVGEVVEKNLNTGKDPLIFHGGKYWKLGDPIEKPAQEKLDAIRKLVEQEQKK